MFSEAELPLADTRLKILWCLCPSHRGLVLIDIDVDDEPIWWQPSWATGGGISWPYTSGDTFTSL